MIPKPEFSQRASILREPTLEASEVLNTLSLLKAALHSATIDSP